jgi:hypothetical protein
MDYKAPPTLRAFLGSLIDYAGVFPPAKLELEQAAANYIEYARDPALAAFLGRFVVPADALSRLAPLVERAEVEIPVSVVVRNGGRISAIAQDLDAFDRQAGAARVASVELSPGAVDGTAADWWSTLANAAAGPRELFVEIDWKTGGGPSVETAARLGAGIKVRTGGAAPADIPPASVLAGLFLEAAKTGTRIKATAGLHQPFPRTDELTGARLHGFLNVFTAAMAAYAGKAGAVQLEGTIADLAPSGFRFADDALLAGDLRFTLDEIVRLRRQAAGFGSCDFLEPLEGLRASGLLVLAQPNLAGT